MRRLIGLIVLLVLAGAATPVNAQAAPAVGTYQPGWNMVGGPPGTSFAGAVALYAWQGGAYVSPSSPVATACVGYWAYFNAATAIPLAASTATTQTCPLSSGWNLVGNPFTSATTLPSGTTAFIWNTVTGAYLPVTSIGPGQSAWIYASAAGTVTLTSSGTPSVTPPPTLTINYLSGAGGPFQIHVGDTVRVLVPSFVQATAAADPAHLRLIDAGYLYDLTCAAGSCQTNPTATFWTWQAIAPGTTFITVTPSCQLSTPPCAQPTQAIQITVLP